ncbi:MAG: hypothetical protein RLZZ04_1058 [Cyanobacteriota bacterium]
MDIIKADSLSTNPQATTPSPVLSWLSSQGQFSLDKAEIIESLSQEFEVQDYELGEQILVQPNAAPNAKLSNEQQYFFVVCEGRVRLLGFDADKKREVSTNLLLEGEIFGAQFFLSEHPLPYKVQAASKVQVARINLAKLDPFLKKLPELALKWRVIIHEQQKLIFFKTQTEFRFLSSHRLKQLLPYLSEKKIRLGTKVVAKDQKIHFWLRSGQIQNQNFKAGDSWGYPSPAEDWTAQTILHFYELSPTNWQAFAELAPELVEAWRTNSTPVSSGQISSGNKINSRTSPSFNALAVIKPPSIGVSYVEEAPPEQQEAPPEQQEQEVEYPKPLKRRGLWKTYPYIEQQSSSDCSAACLTMISRYWGKSVGINYLRELIGVGRSGASLKNLAVAAEKIGYHARPVRASLSRILEQDNPWIAHWKGDHYIVVYRIKNNKLLVADPAAGKFELDRAEFLESWTGFALLLDPTENLANAPTQKRTIGRFFTLLLPYRSVGITVIIASILIQLIGLVSPLFTQIILDQVVVNRSQSTLNVLVVGMLLFGALGGALTSIRSYLLSYLANRLDLTMISGFINHALNLPLKFFESRRVGDIITRVQENQKIQQFLIENVLLSWLDFLTGFVYMGLMLYYNWKLTALILCLIPPIVLLTLTATPLLRKVSRERFNATADQNSSLVEMMSGIATVKSVTAEKDLRWRWEELLTRQLNVQFKGQKLAINLGFLSNMINTIGGAVLLWYGATLVIKGELSIGQYVAFNMMKGYIISPVLVLVGVWDELQEVLISVERLNDVFDAKTEEPLQSNKLVLPRLRGDLELDNVTFRYEGDEETNILQNVSLKVRAGQTVAIVGRSGSGKSTLVNLIQGMYEPVKGTISIDGHNLKHVSMQSLRSQMGVVPQSCYLFSGTILENITLYRSEFTLEEVIATSKVAEAHAFIQSLPLGYNTKVGERGDNLSGGQRQRISIARAFLGDPPILILDEATSSLDTESERRFQDNLSRLSRNRTTFIIAHRLSTVRNADCIVVLDRGMIVEQGNHDELFAQKGLYYDLAKQQLSL